MNAEKAAVMAKKAAMVIRTTFQGPVQAKIGLLLGTGWGDVLDIQDAQRMPLPEIPGFESVEVLEGHAHELVYGTLGGVPVFALRGRIHLNEAPMSREIYTMARLQVEMLFELGVETLILTCAVGALGGRIRPDMVAVIDGFVVEFAPAMPLFRGEFKSPDDTLDPGLREIAMAVGREVHPGGVITGGHVMLRGPLFEGPKYDKPFLALTGATVVGMSVLPEACVAAVFDRKVLGLAFVTNNETDEHSHPANLAAAKKKAETLGGLLTGIVERIDA